MHTRVRMQYQHQQQQQRQHHQSRDACCSSPSCNSDDTEKLCDDTLEMVKSFQIALANRAADAYSVHSGIGKKNRPGSAAAVPAARKVAKQRRRATFATPQIGSSNASNVASWQQQQQQQQHHRHQQPSSSLVTSPCEIRLLLRLDSWLDANGVLMVRPSVHQEEDDAQSQSTESAPEDLELSGGTEAGDAAAAAAGVGVEKQPRLEQQLVGSGTQQLTKGRQQPPSRRDRSLVGGGGSGRRSASTSAGGSVSAAGWNSGKVSADAMLLIKKLHRLLSAELKR